MMVRVDSVVAVTMRLRGGEEAALEEINSQLQPHVKPCGQHSSTPDIT